MLYLIRLTCERTGADDIQFQYGAEGPALDTLALANLAGAFVDAFTLTLENSQHAVALTLAEAYGPEGGPALVVAQITPARTFGVQAAGPADIALRQTLLVSTARGNTPRGGPWLGPFNPGTSIRPSVGLRQAVVDHALALRDDWALQGYAMTIVSTREGGLPRPSPVGLPVTGASCDDAWDTIRSRGLQPTTKTLLTF